MMVGGIVYCLITQDGNSVVSHLNCGMEKAFTLIITLTPIMCFWSGIMEIAQRSGVTELISKILSPLINLLFGNISKNAKIREKITMNMSANMLGMGNAATPLGLEAMSELDKINLHPNRASNAMCMFIVINTASIQLVPSSVIALRGQFGSQTPSDIIIPTLITTMCAFLVGTISAKICARIFK
ncbi:MAG: nucleoside recognition domain-containing protein [Clostridia bacterium]